MNDETSPGAADAPAYAPNDTPSAPTSPAASTEADIARETDAAQARLEAARARARLSLPPAGARAVEIGALVARVTARVAAADPAELRRRAEVTARQRVADLRARAVTIEAPEDEDLRLVALDDEAFSTDAMHAFRAALAWRGARRRGMVVMVGGPPGVGKTAGMVSSLLRTDVSALFVHASEIAATPKNGYSENLHAWGRWQSVQILAIDDLGAEIGDAEAITALLCARYDAGRATLCTTNLEAPELVRRYFVGSTGRRLADRLVNAQGTAPAGASGLAWYIGVEGRSLRHAPTRDAITGGA